jgi:PPOX class probable F420-dependent enzyme
MTALPEAVRAKLERPLFWQLATINADGWPNVKPVWVGLEGDRILVNTGKGWTRHTNVLRDPRVTLAIAEPDNPYERVEIRGVVVEIVEGQRGFDHLDSLAQRYLGLERYPWLREGEVRIILVIEPRLVIHHADDADPETLPVA